MNQEVKQAVLGIDAAWTIHQPSGVALAVETSRGWRIVAAESSYQRFQAFAESRSVPQLAPSGSPIEVEGLLASAERLCGRLPDLVAVDMPLSHSPITGRRKSDREVSRAYGAKQCGTHSPSADRPGQVSDQLRQNFEAAGFPLQTLEVRPPGLIEVYPHPALVELFDAPKRLPYKVGRVRQYWPDLAPVERRSKLYGEWRLIAEKLEAEVRGVSAALPPLGLNATGAAVKAFEDTLDAMICAWIGIRALQGRAKPFGDDQSAIWVPRPKAS